MTIRITIEDVKEVAQEKKRNPKMGGMRATKMDRNSEIGEPTIFDVILDCSGSMDDLRDDLVDCFNTIMIPALAGVCQRNKNALRLGCMLFSGQLIPAWYGYKSLKELGPKPLKREMLDQPGLGGGTALYGAMRAGLLWTASAMKEMSDEGDGETPTGKIIILTDGANTLEPSDPSTVKRTVDGLGKAKVKKVIGFFNTSQGLKKHEFDAMVKNTGFEGVGFYDIAGGSDLKAKRASFRHYFDLFSKDAANK